MESDLGFNFLIQQKELFMKNLRIRVKNWEKYQHYKKKNKNFNNQQPWFMFHGREFLNDVDFMTLSPEDREFLIVGCWAIGSQYNGFLPNPEQHAFMLRRPIEEVMKYRDFFLESGWLEVFSEDEYEVANEKICLEKV